MDEVRIHSEEIVGEAATAGDMPELTGFTKSVLSLMDKVEYRRCESGEAFEDVARLRHKAFLTAGMMDGDPGGSMKDELDTVPNAQIFGIYVEGRLASTLRLHLVSRECPKSSAMRVFSDLLLPELAAGKTFIDPTRLSSDPEMKGNFGRLMPYVILRLAVMSLDHHMATACLSMVREEHLGFYTKVFRSVSIAEPRPCPPFVVPVFLYSSERERNMAATLEKYPFFRSSREEREALFSPVSDGSPVIPSARQVLRAA